MRKQIILRLGGRGCCAERALSGGGPMGDPTKTRCSFGKPSVESSGSEITIPTPAPVAQRMPALSSRVRTIGPVRIEQTIAKHGVSKSETLTLGHTGTLAGTNSKEKGPRPEARPWELLRHLRCRE